LRSGWQNAWVSGQSVADSEERSSLDDKPEDHSFQCSLNIISLRYNQNTKKLRKLYNSSPFFVDIDRHTLGAK
jgi:hypothetical protein